MKNMKAKYYKLLMSYDKAIDDIYNHDNSSSSDYTPDWMRSDWNGFAEEYEVEEYDYYNKLKQAVNKAELYVKYLNHEYNFTFG
jgi:hypothetical protein|tara:strand:+ start:479 stop:730 length:252 start_codon:yes stop_codon:yes gene_type:complete